VNYVPDANDLAKSWERREASADPLGLHPTPRTPRPRTGRLKIWSHVNDLLIRNQHPMYEASSCFVEHQPGYLIVRSTVSTSVEVLYPAPGWYLSFDPDADEGE
jgi:hypothetical protein